MSLKDSISVLPKKYTDELKGGASAEYCAHLLSERILELETSNILMKNELSFLFGQSLIPSKYKSSILKAIRTTDL